MKKEEKMHISLAHLPPYGVSMPPLGICYLASKLKEEGFSVKAFDLNLDYYLNEKDSNKNGNWYSSNSNIKEREWREKVFRTFAKKIIPIDENK
ncbi:MAG: hypothetical protein NTV63_00140 [Candidatus Woesearchaeota archaeon]|nr:hypothetical protein [Candidatus Woesearchaeota archaeon]